MVMFRRYERISCLLGAILLTFVIVCYNRGIYLNNDSGARIRRTSNISQHVKSDDYWNSREYKQATKILMFVAIYSEPDNKEKRDTLRRTWLKRCTEKTECAYKFFVSEDIAGENVNKTLSVESEINNRDIIMINSKTFGKRLYDGIKVAAYYFMFSFIILVDENHYVCLDKLSNEFPKRREYNIYWGRKQCTPENYSYLAEEITILSNDLALALINENIKNEKSFVAWQQRMTKDITWFTDNRILQISNQVGQLSKTSGDLRDVCSSSIAVGGITNQMESFHKLVLLHELMLSGPKNEIRNIDIPSIVNHCKL